MPDFDNGSNANVAATPATPAAAPTPAAPAPAQAAPAPSQAPATSGAPEGYVPSYRLRETRAAMEREFNSAMQAREAAYREELQRVQQQLHALVGVQPPQNPEQDEIRAQFAKIYPGLSKLEEQAAQLQTLLERAGDLESQTNHYWQSYGRQSMDRLFSAAEQSLGAPLTEEGRRALHSAFVGFVQSSPELTARYAEDPSIVTDFWRMFSASLIDPVRRGTAVQQQARVPQGIPQDTPSGVPRATPGPQPANMDERAAVAWAAYNNLTQNRG